MEIRLANRMSILKASEIRELLKLTEQPDIISFAGGLPAPELFPIDKIREAANKVLSMNGEAALQYSTTEGYRPLRKIIATERMGPAGVDATEDDILITSGSQQGLDFSGRVFINPGDVIVCESPSYLGAINAFRAYEPKFVEVEMDDNGLIIEKLEQVLIEYPDTKFIYTIPDFQNPTGKTLSVDRRKRLVELALSFNIPIIEDSPYGELNFEGDRLPAIKSFDKEGIVIHLGTFSKIFCPGLRLGWVCAHPDLLTKYIIVKQGADLQANSLSQRESTAFMEENNLNEHIKNIRSVYKKRRDVMLQTMSSEFPCGINWTNPKGGLFTWVTLPEGIDAADVLKLAIGDKVAFVPGGSFFPNGGKINYFRLSFSSMPEEKIIEGIKRLGKVLKSLQ